MSSFIIFRKYLLTTFKNVKVVSALNLWQEWNIFATPNIEQKSNLYENKTIKNKITTKKKMPTFNIFKSEELRSAFGDMIDPYGSWNI